MEPKPVSASRVTLSLLMPPAEANPLGNVHGGYIMRLMDEAGASAAMRHCGRPVVTVAVDQVLFKEPIHVGDLVTFHAELTYVGRTSLEARIEVASLNLLNGETTHTNTAFCVYVALDVKGRPVAVPPLKLETDGERRQWALAQERQAYRLAQRQRQQDGDHD
jgi:acyl-CoA hydrolase